MMLRKSLAVLEDLNGCVICSVVGDTEFIYNTIKNSLKEFLAEEKDESLKAIVENGNLVLSRHYLEYIHDNTPMNNFCFAFNSTISFPTKDILEIDFSSREYCETFYEQLQKYETINKKLLLMLKKSGRYKEIPDIDVSMEHIKEGDDNEDKK